METRTPLERRPDERIIAGVCAGLAEHLGLPVTWVRVAMVIGIAAGGATGILYLFLFLTVPQRGETDPVLPLRRVFTPQGTTTTPEALPERPARGWRLPVAEILLGGSLVIAGLALLFNQLGVGLRLQVILPALAASVGIGLTWWLIMDRDRPERHPLPRVLGALSLVAVGVIMFFITAREPTVISVIGAALAVLAGVALAIAPWLLRLNRQLVAERAARERESQRAEIAAHLHDSVLQTLALIQQQSEPGTEVARLARGQERELREWLFMAADGGVGAEQESLASALSAHGASLEETHAVRFDVVAVGERVPAPEAILAAAREAMQNAARHAGGDVSVYVETTPGVHRVEVNDRGPGFDPQQIPGQRLGVRESIIGRMERAGASARIAPGPGGRGTSVRLEQDRTDAATTRQQEEK